MAVQVQWLPAVGPAGENLVRAPEEPRLAAWWRGPCVLGAIDAFGPPARNVARPLRLPVAEVGKGARGGTAVSGKLEAGALRVRRVSHNCVRMWGSWIGVCGGTKKLMPRLSTAGTGDW